MKSILKIFLPAVMAALLTGAAPVRADVRAEIREATGGFRDITLTGKVTYANVKELKKIGKDFPKSYEIKDTLIRFKSPDKMRVEGKLGMLRVIMIINSDKKAFFVPSLKYSDKEDITGKPHKKQGELDIGIITESLWAEYVVAGADQDDSSGSSVHRIRFTRTNSPNENMLVWLDGRDFRLLKLEKYDRGNVLRSRTIYLNHQRHEGIWVPAKINLYNSDGKLAATSVYRGVRVNKGLADSLFRI